MSIAPEPILRAGNDAVSWACIFVRNETIREGASTQMINDIMEAIHEVPRMLLDWNPGRLREVRNHLACFPAARWPGSPDLLSRFNIILTESGYIEECE